MRSPGIANALLSRPAQPQASGCLLPAAPHFVPRLGRASKRCRISPAPPLHPAAFPRSDLRADVPCSLTGKSPSPRLSLTENSRPASAGERCPPPARVLRRCPAPPARGIDQGAPVIGGGGGGLEERRRAGAAAGGGWRLKSSYN